MISLFYEQPRARRGISGLALSCFLHGASMGLAVYAVLYAPRIQIRPIAERYTVRHLQLNSPNSPATDGTDGAIQYPGRDAGKASLDSLLEGDDDNSPAQSIPQPPETAAGVGGRQTLLQPDFQSRQDFAIETPLPTVVLWKQDLTSHKLIVAPHPATPTTSSSRPALDAPNQEKKLADTAAATTADRPKLPAPTPASTSPIATQVPAVVEMPPATVSISPEKPTPATLLSLSDLRMPIGSITVPPIHETKTNQQKAQIAPAAEHGPGSAKFPGTSQAAKAALPSANAPQPAAGNGAAPQAHPGANAQPPDPPNSAHIVLPKNGKFSVVVVGSSLADEYPEILQIWNNRMAYTAFLHVGMPKNWIMQYAQVRNADVESQGNGGQIEAPWPYDIFRPNLISTDLNADALMVHGTVDEQGHFQHLAVAFPADFDRASLVLHALQRWQFRPARQNGKPTSVEVLLIIPDEWD